MTADDIILCLQLEPHPEGGAFRETFRDSVQTHDGRAASTAIYFLLRGGEISRWHRVDASEVWHWYAGAPLRLSILPPNDAQSKDIMLGPDLVAGQRPQAIVPAHTWQRAESVIEADPRSDGQANLNRSHMMSNPDWTLVGCTVAPGFDFAGFELASDDFDPASLP
ncbi:MAG: cupin domain-containing protein [Hyphomicrobiaceae bacterium]